MGCEICGKDMFLDEHHIRSKCYGGSDKLSNKANLCANCHKLVHYGLIILEGRFDCTSGNILVWRKLHEQSVTDIEDPKVYIVPNTQHVRDNYLKKMNNQKVNEGK